MKKNFLMVASLLIAAMLLVVSCSQEVAPKNELVEAKLVANFGRDLAVEGDTSAKNLSLEYKMTRNWNNPNPTDSLYENIVGEKEWTSLPDSGFVGWVTPGLWTIKVRAIASGATSEVFYGKVDAYYSQSQKTAVVYLEPEKASKNNKIEITVSMQDIKVGEGENQKSYKLQYEILPGSGTGNAIVSKTDMSSSAKTGFTNVTEYKANKTGLDSGFYTVVVYVLDEKDAVVGGIRKGFLLANNTTASITGHIEPADYADVTIETVYVDVDIELKQKSVSAKDTEGKVTVAVTLKDTTDVKGTPAKLSEFNKTYVLMVNGVVDTQTTLEPTAEGTEYTFKFDKPGNKTIAVQAIYTSKNKTGVFFTETESIVVYVAPEKFE